MAGRRVREGRLRKLTAMLVPERESRSGVGPSQILFAWHEMALSSDACALPEHLKPALSLGGMDQQQLKQTEARGRLKDRQSMKLTQSNMRDCPVHYGAIPLFSRLTIPPRGGSKGHLVWCPATAALPRTRLPSEAQVQRFRGRSAGVSSSARLLQPNPEQPSRSNEAMSAPRR
jgi:hypothetical protein